MRSVARSAHLVVAWVLVAGLVIQIFLAGLGVFRGPESFLPIATSVTRSSSCR
jgi:hypothetical protein